jgi:hypothetical protein
MLSTKIPKIGINVKYDIQTLHRTVELSGLRQLACLFAPSPAKSMTASKSAAAICSTSFIPQVNT